MTTTEITETTEITPTTCTVSEGALRKLLTDLARTADDGPTGHPMFQGVLLHTADHDGEPVLVATSSNRYVAAQRHTKCSGALPAQVFVALPHVRAIAEHLVNSSHQAGSAACEECGGREECRRCDSREWIEPRMVELAPSPRGGRLRVRVVPANGDRAESVSVVVPVDKQLTLPASVMDLLAGPGGEQVPGPVVLSMATLEALAAIPHRSEAFQVTGYGPGEPVLVQVGDCYRAVAMPVRVNGVDLAPVFELPGREAS